MGISGTQKAPLYSQFGIARFGATRFGYYPAYAYVSIAGTHVAFGRAAETYRLESASLTITDNLDESPNTCEFVISGYTPSEGQEIIITLGSKNNLDRLFAGHILTVTQLQDSAQGIVRYAVTCIDYTWLLQGRKVIKRYTNQSASAIIADLITTFAPAGFTTTHVQAGLDVIDEITFSSGEDLPGAITRLMRRIGGYWYADYLKDIHAFVGTESGVTQPVDLTVTHSSFNDFQYRRDLSQVVTRVLVEGGGAVATIARVAGDTTLPIEDATWYVTAGGTIVSGPQRITYTGKQAGGTGSTVAGVNQSPSAVTAAAATGDGGLSTSGAYLYKVLFSSPNGDSEVSAASNSITLSAVTAPGAPTAALASPKVTGNLRVGTTYHYKTTFVTANGGETLGGSASGAVAPAAVPAPTTVCTTISGTTGGSLTTLATYVYLLTYVTAAGETTQSGSVSQFLVGSENAMSLTGISTSSDGRVTKRRLYRTKANAGGAGPYYLVTTINDNTTTSYTDTTADSALVVPIPTANTATDGEKASLTSIPTSADARVTKRRIYRSEDGGTTYKQIAQINDNSTTTLTDNDIAGATAIPAASTATTGAINLTAIPVGPTGTTQRKLYRTLAGGSLYKYLATIDNNSATTYTDTSADSSLGEEAPTGSTWPTVLASTTLQVNDLAQFPASGWVRAESQVVRYTGRSGASGVGTLTGIPASGTGSIIAAIAAGSSVVVEPHLTGIPASGAGAILYTINQGDPVNILVTRNNTSAQTALAALIGGDGVVEEYLTDNRLSYDECVARGDATLDLRSAVEASIQYRCRDKNTRAGRTITVSIAAPTNVSASFKIQSVTISGFSHKASLFPTFTASASTNRFSFEDLLRLARKGGEAA